MCDEGIKREHSSWGKRLVVLVVFVLAAAFGWHVYLCSRVTEFMDALRNDEDTREITEIMSIDINPVTNLATVKVTLPPEVADNPFAGVTEAVMAMAGPGLLERQMNTAARARYDLYAMLIPYRALVVVEQPSPEQVEEARRRAKRETARRKKQDKAREERNRRERLAYAAKHLALENVRVGRGKSWGRDVWGVFGTIVNNGPKTLTEVRIRVFFLDKDGHRIGEKDFTPLLVSSLDFSDDAPLRPGYREDFGYNVEDDAPSGWAKTVQVQIVDVEMEE